MSHWRIGVVSYLNTKPLVYDLASHLSADELRFDLPSRLADGLAAGQLDVALVPSIEVLAHPEYQLVSDACIACRGPVWSVRLISRVPFAEIRTLALDEGSRTSAMLVQVLLAEQFSVSPTLQPLDIDERWYETSADAALIIGDRAMSASHDDFKHQLDLGQWWCQWTQRPFVFAMWAARPGIATQRIAELLGQARDAGLSNLDQIARCEAPRYGLSFEQCRAYFEDHLHFHFGSSERDGLELFRQKLAQRDYGFPSLEIQSHGS